MDVILNFCVTCGGLLPYGFRNPREAKCPHCSSPVDHSRVVFKGTFNEEDARTLLALIHEDEGGQLPSKLRLPTNV